jgi:predicted nuclease of predicted toxin-antitoxin system
MIFWLNAQLPPSMAHWLAEIFGVSVVTLYDLGLRDAQDIEIFAAARANGIGTVVISKDQDFVDLVTRSGPPPQLLWLTCGNITNRDLKRIFSHAFPAALALLQKGESIVEIGKAPAPPL